MVAGNKELRARLVEETKRADVWCSNSKLELVLVSLDPTELEAGHERQERGGNVET